MKLPFIASLALTAGLLSCTPNHGTVELFAICAPPKAADSCSTNGKCEALLAAPRPWVYLTVNGVGGVVDNELVLFVQFNNQRQPNDNASAGRVNTSDAKLEKYKYKFDGVAVPDMESPANGTIPAGSSSTPVVPIIPVAAGALMQGLLPAGQSLVTVEIRAAGRYDDGSDFETGPFKVAVDVFNGTFPGYSCPKAGQVVTAICPNAGQTSTIVCAAP